MENEEKNLDPAQSADAEVINKADEAQVQSTTEPESADSIQHSNSASVPQNGNIPGSANRRPALPWMIISIVLLAALIYALVQPPFDSGKQAVAEVNGQSITKDKLYDTMVKTGGTQTLDSLITQEVIDQEAEKSKVTVSDKEVQYEMDMIKKSFPDEAQYNQMLAQYGMTEDDLKKEMGPQVKLKKLLEPKIKISEDDVKKYYDENKAQFAKPEQVRASHILVKTKEEAQDVLDQLKNGSDFAKLAAEKSIDPGTKDVGGDLNYFERGAMTKPFSDAAFSLKKDELSGIVQTEFGFHIIKVTDHKQAVNPTFEDKKEEIRYMLVSQEVSSQSQAYLDELKSKAKITNLLSPDEKNVTAAEK